MPRPQTAKVIARTEDRTLVIQRLDVNEEWVTHRCFPEDTSIDYARTTMERYGKQNADGVYRLVEYVTVTTETMEVL